MICAAPRVVVLPFFISVLRHERSAPRPRHHPSVALLCHEYGKEPTHLSIETMGRCHSVDGSFRLREDETGKSLKMQKSRCM